MPNQLDAKTKKSRVSQLRELSERLEAHYYNGLIGNKTEVLLEEEKDGFYYGYTPDYLRISVLSDVQRGQIVNVRLKKGFRGEIC